MLSNARLNARSLFRLATECEYGVLLRGNTIPVTPENSVDVPLITIARFTDGSEELFREGIAGAEQARCGECSPERLFADEQSGLYRVVDCCWYAIARTPDRAEFPDVVERGDRYVIERDGQIVCAAWSSQDGAFAAEVEVETNPAHRRRGYARQTVTAWAHHTRRAGKIAFYSHLVANDASRSLAASIGAEWYADTREYFPS